MLAERDAEQIHAASMALLGDPGVRIEHDGIVDRLLRAGAKAGGAAQVVRFPPELIVECLAQAPSSVFFADRPTQDALEAGAPRGHTVEAKGDSLIWSTPGMRILRGGVHRPFTRADMADWTRLIDALPNVHGVFGLSMDDVPAPARDVVGLRVMVENTGKHVRALCFTPRGAEVMREMGPIVSDQPWFSVGFTAHGPLRWTRLALEIFERTAGRGIPATINGEPMAGASAPVTLAGAAAVGNAEILAGLAVNQILEPGRPCVYNLGLAHIFDMRAAVAVTGGPENHLLADISAAMGRFYGLPSASWVSTESMLPDAQAALEKSAGFLSHLQSRVGLIWGVGQLESEITVSPAQAVIDDEMVGYARRLLRGVEVDERTLAVEVTREVGIAGEFLSHEHTRERFRDELFLPSILWRGGRARWGGLGAKSLAEAAEERAEALMAREAPPRLTDDQSRALRDIERDFLKSL
jgi:trimethylamine--corrinoid protein Co-methyltransferase